MTIKHKFLALGITLVMLFSTVAVAKPAYAASSWFSGNIFSKLIDFITQKFNLDKTQVQNAVSEFQTQEQASITPRPTPDPQQIADREKQRLDVLVSDGKITADQETAIISELQTLRDKYPFSPQANQNQEERQIQFQNLQNDWNTWANQNGIDPTLIRPFAFGPGFSPRRGFDQDSDDIRGGMMRHGFWGTNVTPTPTSS